ncbi:ac92-like protein, putative sulfhydryl oxidase-1 [Microplitis demolitor]|uniref:Bracovirus particle protein p33-1 n=1 Tax=Microplitis demolitor TaxID=69319 RepID=UPI0004400386|nr:ac92-like protein, putative sulfhydryl oxidase-1 [Microplitis demolitor]KAG6558536.1 ac92-like protein, putative sulfhydryl oxidase-1 [Microplitis demolitor]
MNILYLKQPITRHQYVFNEHAINILKNRFRIYLNRFLAYIRTYNPILTDEQEFEFAIFLKTLFKLIVLVTECEKKDSILNEIDNMSSSFICHVLLYEKCREFFGLTLEIDRVKLEEIDWSLDSWGKNYWRFLHALSIILQYHYEKKSVRSLHNYLAALLLNFDLVLPCSNCRYNYKNQNPLINVSLPLIYSEDAIFMVYSLHNDVRSVSGIDKYSFNQFLHDWGIQISASNVSTLDAKYLL